jgi:hypothetical protein
MKTFSVQLLSWNALHRTAFLKGQSDGLPEQLESPVSIYDYKWAIYFNWCESKEENDYVRCYDQNEQDFSIEIKVLVPIPNNYECTS